jgi:hypothetical protein
MQRYRKDTMQKVESKEREGSCDGIHRGFRAKRLQNCQKLHK